jgi:hypothetical protein
MPRRDVSRRFVRGGVRSLMVESGLVAALFGGTYLMVVLLERLL